MVVVWRRLAAGCWLLVGGCSLEVGGCCLEVGGCLPWPSRIFTKGAKLLETLVCRFGCFWMEFGFVSSRNLLAGRIQLSSLKNHISLIWHRFWLIFGAFIDMWVRNPTKLSLHQLDFWRSRYWIFNGKRSTLADCEIWLWRMWFPWSFSFYFSCITFPESYGC